MWFFNPLTFSRSRTLGFLPFSIFVLTMLAMLKKSVPLASSKPFLRPAIEKGWHGNPPQRMSKSGIVVGSASFMSPLKYM
jgi:hypothetical protein